MQFNINRAEILGLVSRQPELKSTTSGKTQLSFSVGTMHRYQDKDKNWKSTQEWHNVIMWGRSAEFIGKRLEKGERVHVVGRMSTNTFEGRDGQKRTTFQIIAENVIPLGKPPGAPKPAENHSQEDVVDDPLY